VTMKLIEYSVAASAFFLIGANVALLVEFGRFFSSWWTLKLSAVMVLLAYVTASMIYGNPDEFRVGIGVAAVLIDVFAFIRVYRAVRFADRDRLALVVFHPSGGRNGTTEG